MHPWKWQSGVRKWDEKPPRRRGAFSHTQNHAHAHAHAHTHTHTHQHTRANARFLVGLSRFVWRVRHGLAVPLIDSDVSTRIQVVPTFQEIVVRTSGSMIAGKSCSISHQVLERVSDTAQPQGGKSGHHAQKELQMVADITRVSNGQHSSVILYPGKDAVRSLLLVVGINEASRLRPKAVHDGAAPRDKFDRDYEELSTEWQLNEEGLHVSDTESESDSSSSFGSTMMGMAGYSSH
jgi:hypothetical protein